MSTSLRAVELSPRSDGARYRRVTLALAPDGALALASHEMGAAPEAAWGLDDAEMTLTVAADQIGPLVLALASELLAGQPDAVGRLRDLCEAHGIEARVACWT